MAEKVAQNPMLPGEEWQHRILLEARQPQSINYNLIITNQYIR
jgi:hypothetical protein